MNFSRGVGGSLSHLWKFRRGGGAISSLQKWKIQGGGGVLSEIPSVVGVWIFSGTTQWPTMTYNDLQWPTMICNDLQWPTMSCYDRTCNPCNELKWKTSCEYALFYTGYPWANNHLLACIVDGLFDKRAHLATLQLTCTCKKQNHQLCRLPIPLL